MDEDISVLIKKQDYWLPLLVIPVVTGIAAIFFTLYTIFTRYKNGKM